MTDRHDDALAAIDEVLFVDATSSDDHERDIASASTSQSFAELVVSWANRTLPHFINQACTKHRDYLSRAGMSLLGCALCAIICFFSTQFALTSGASMTLVFWCIDAVSAIGVLTFVIYALICTDVYVGGRGQHAYLKEAPRLPLTDIRDVLELMRDNDLHEAMRVNDIIAQVTWEVTDATEVTNIVTGETQTNVNLRAIEYTDLDPIKMLVKVTPAVGSVVNIIPQWADLTVDDDGHIYVHADTYGTDVIKHT